MNAVVPAAELTTRRKLRDALTLNAALVDGIEQMRDLVIQCQNEREDPVVTLVILAALINSCLDVADGHV